VEQQRRRDHSQREELRRVVRGGVMVVEERELSEVECANIVVIMIVFGVRLDLSTLIVARYELYKLERQRFV
jgi:hypothetical protein